MNGGLGSLQRSLSCPLSLVPVGGFIAHVESTCLLDDDGTAKDFTYCVSFNKDLLTCWDRDKSQMVPLEFGALNPLAKYLSEFLNHQESVLSRLSNGLQDCATHTQSFWGSLTHRTRKKRGAQRGYWEAQLGEEKPGRIPPSLHPSIANRFEICAGKKQKMCGPGM